MELLVDIAKAVIEHPVEAAVCIGFPVALVLLIGDDGPGGGGWSNGDGGCGGGD